MNYGVLYVLKVVIVEDEKRICNMIATFIDWNGLGFEIAGTADNGTDGLELILSIRPDVIITDIRMPGCDGIEMIAGIKEELPYADVIIISGHKQFDYAHKAIKYGIRYYLLKPIMETELQEILMEILKRRKKSLSHNNIMRDMEETISYQNDVLRSNFISDLCENRDKLTGQSIPAVNAKYAAAFVPKLFSVMLIRCNKRYSNDTSGAENVLLSISQLVEKSYSDAAEEVVYGINSYGLTIVLNYSPENSGEISRRHKEFMKNAARRIEVLGMYLLYIGVGRECAYEELWESFDSALLAIRSRVFSSEDGLIYYEQEWDPDTNTGNIVSFDYYSQLLTYIKMNNPGGTDSWFSKLSAMLSDCSSLTLSQLYGVSYHIFDYVTELVESGMKKKLPRGKLREEMETALLDANSISGFVRILQDRIKKLAAESAKNTGSGHSGPVSKALEYINNSYGSQIKLEDVAKYVYLNPTYFSELFKAECGVTFSDYLQNLRMESAKRLLRETDLGIAQIAQNVGYSDSKYFSKTFTKLVGIKPTGYRKLYI